MTYAHCAEFHCHPTFWRINECRESLLFDVYALTAYLSNLAMVKNFSSPDPDRLRGGQSHGDITSFVKKNKPIGGLVFSYASRQTDRQTQMPYHHNPLRERWSLHVLVFGPVPRTGYCREGPFLSGSVF